MVWRRSLGVTHCALLGRSRLFGQPRKPMWLVRMNSDHLVLFQQPADHCAFEVFLDEVWNE